MYTIIRNKETKENYCIRRTEDGASIPFDERNRDYIEYLEWVAEGNEAEIEER